MNESVESLMHIRDLHKVFVTEETETDALSGILLDLEKGDHISIRGAPGRRTSILQVDELTGSLASNDGGAVPGLLSDLHREGATICIVPRGLRYVDRTATLFHGRIMDDEKAEEDVA